MEHFESYCKSGRCLDFENCPFLSVDEKQNVRDQETGAAWTAVATAVIAQGATTCEWDGDRCVQRPVRPLTVLDPENYLVRLNLCAACESDHAVIAGTRIDDVSVRERARQRADWLGYKNESEIIDFVAGYVNAMEDVRQNA